MNLSSIKAHLKEYSIYDKRRTTINHAFASSLSVPDRYDEKRLVELLQILEISSDNIVCAYCRKEAETWDHVEGLVNNNEFSGYGHQYGNLLPCCKTCNSKKGNKKWNIWLTNMVEKKYIVMSQSELDQRINQINNYIEGNTLDIRPLLSNPTLAKQLQELNETKTAILKLMQKADKQAQTLRQSIRTQLNK